MIKTSVIENYWANNVIIAVYCAQSTAKIAINIENTDHIIMKYWHFQKCYVPVLLLNQQMQRNDHLQMSADPRKSLEQKYVNNIAVQHNAIITIIRRF
jgi:hypothetical protein